MMPLTMAKEGEVNIVKRVSGKAETKKFLESLGFVVAVNLRLCHKIGGNLIVNVKDSELHRKRYG